MPQPHISATVPLEARLEPWMDQLLADSAQVRNIVSTFGSPTNVLHTSELVRNAAELVDAGRGCGVETRVFFARKANKALAFVDAAAAAGHGIDVASYWELDQVLQRGIAGRDIIVSAAVKDDRLLRRALEASATISCDSVAELDRIGVLAEKVGCVARVAPRLAPAPKLVAPTRFGELLHKWQAAAIPASVDIVGIHFHLGGYAEEDRRKALSEALILCDHFRGVGCKVEFIDIGGGVPMSYLKDRSQFDEFQRRLELQRRGSGPGAGAGFTWANDPLTNTYPFWQSPTRGAWLRQLLEGEVAGFGRAADALSSRGLRLHLEPGRSLLDGCGVILAEVAFLKERSDGLPLIGVAMNRTQCRTAADDILLDPVLVPCAQGLYHRGAKGAPQREDVTGYLVGAYCIENEVIIRREMRATQIAVGDVIAIPNTAGYFMHILESASHQIPLAHNVILRDNGEIQLDDIHGERL